MEKKKSNRDGLLLRDRSEATTSELVLQWGNRKRLRCMKQQGKDKESVGQRSITARVVRSPIHQNKEPLLTAANINLRQRSSSPAHRLLRNCEGSIGMKGQSNGGRGVCSPDKRSNNGGGSGSSETAKGGTSAASEAVPTMWPPKFAIGLTNKEKEEDFLAIKGSKLPQRPKKRAKFIQRTINLVSPGGWLCDLTLERYEVREKKMIKKRPRGLKAMGLGGSMESESE